VLQIPKRDGALEHAGVPVAGRVQQQGTELVRQRDGRIGTGSESRAFLGMAHTGRESPSSSTASAAPIHRIAHRAEASLA
jgi:hypothetical protein